MGARGAYRRQDGARERRLSPHLDLWFDARPVSACPEGMAYFRNLGFEDMAVPVEWRFHAACSHPSQRTLPAIVMPVRLLASGIGAVFRIYVHGGALADVQPPRAALGKCPEGAIRVYEPTRVPGQVGRLMVVAGVERALAAVTALAMHGALDVAVWAVAGAANLAHTAIPADMLDVVLLGTNNVPGVEEAISARIFALRHSGRAVRGGVPPANGIEALAWLPLVRELYP